MKIKFDSFIKFIVLLVVLHGLVCVSLSYVLAFIGKDVIAESLSETVVKEIVAPIMIYGITKTVENVSKYNDWIEKFSEFKYGKPDELEDGWEDETR